MGIKADITNVVEEKILNRTSIFNIGNTNKCFTFIQKMGFFNTGLN